MYGIGCGKDGYGQFWMYAAYSAIKDKLGGGGGGGGGGGVLPLD